MAKFCGRCGTAVLPEQKFCPKCGNTLTTPAGPNRTAKIVAVLALVVFAGGIATYVLTRGHAPPPLAGVASVNAVYDLTALPESKFEVTYQPETVVLDAATTKKTFEGISPDGAVLVFNTSVPATRDLKPGSVLLLQGLALKKVVAVELHGDSIIVATQKASLTDAIENGHIHFDAPVTFGDTASIPGMALTPAFAFAPALSVATVAGTPGEASGSEGGWKFTTKATKAAGSLNLDIDVKGEVEGMNVDVTGRGHVQSFGLMTDIQISHGVVEEFKYVAKNLRGDVTIDFVATRKGDGDLKGLETKLPTSFEMPMPIGGLPFVLAISEVVIVKPALSGKNEVAEGHFKIKYGGGQGFSVSGSSMAADGQAPESEQEITGSSSMGIAPFAYILAIAMPRIELTLGLEKATGFDKLTAAIPATVSDRVAELLSKTEIGSKLVDAVKKTLKSQAAAHVEMVMAASHLDSGPLVLIPCKKTTFDVHANVGYDATALGKTAEGTKELDMGEKHVIQQTPPNIKCGE